LKSDKKNEDKAVFTVVTHQLKYLNFAFALARSYRYHNDLSIPFFIVSDNDFDLPRDLNWVQKKIISPALMGKGLEVRFSFEEVSPALRSLYIDADSIVYRDISALFELPFDSINVIGTTVTEGTWDDMHVPDVMLKFKIPHLIRFCGAFYFIVKNTKTDNVCRMVRELARSEYPFQQHAYSINDEPVFSISLVSEGIQPIVDTGNIWGDIHQLQSHHDLNVLKGKTKFNNSIKNVNYKYWIPEGFYSPSIIHFGGGNYNKNPWLFEAARLKIYYTLRMGKGMADILTSLFVKSPYFGMKRLRSIFTN